MAERIYQTNELIFEAGDPSEFAYIIRTGQVEILRDYPENPLRLAVLGAGDVFGEMGLVDERPRSLTARAISETHLSTVTRDEFVDLLLNNPNDALKYLRMFFERLRAMNVRVTEDKTSTEIIQKPKEFQIEIFPLGVTSEKFLPLDGYPIKNQVFRVGRTSNNHEDPFEVNDLVLLDNPPFNISRNHFSIERTPETVLVHDRGSYLGTIVNGQMIGGHHRSAVVPLKEGENEIIAGSHHSPFKFRVIVNNLTA